jgi:N-acetyl-anhydromuramyl-L-alanine amidase AmpD
MVRETLMSIGDLPYVPAAGDGGPRTVTQLYVIHATDNTASDEAETSYASHRPDKTSAHFYTDDDSTIRSLPLGDIAFGCYPIGNARSVQHELCGISSHVSDVTMRQAAPVVAEACRMYSIPLVKIAPTQLIAGVKGICGHVDVTNAWHQGTHTDPGPGFDWDTFLSYVRAASPGVQVPPWPGRYLRNGIPMMHGEDVRQWQAKMSVRGWRITVDGWYGLQSASVCRAFQAEKGLTVDAIVGPDTWRASWLAPRT